MVTGTRILARFEPEDTHLSQISPELKKPLHGWQGEGRSCSDWVFAEGEIWQGEDIWGLFTSWWNAGELCLYLMQFLSTAMKVLLFR